MIWFGHAVRRHSAVAFVAATLALLPCVGSSPAAARVLAVGPERVLKLPSQASLVAMDGDRVEIDPGRYADCAVWRASRLTIVANGPGVVLAGKTCHEQGIFIVLGRDVTVRGLSFIGARSRFHTGAGIRALGDNLTVEDSRFEDNENGILAGGTAASILRVTDSQFRGNGSCEGACAHGIYAGRPIALLDVEHCRFLDTHVGHHIKSRARATMVIGNRIEDGAEGNASYLIDVPDGGNVLIQGNTLQKGRLSENPGVAISIGEESATNPTGVLIVQDNRFVSDLAESTVFVRNSTRMAAELRGNTLAGRVAALEGPGSAVRP